MMNFSNNSSNSYKDATFMKMEVASGTYQFKVQYSNTKNIFKGNGFDSLDNFITSPIFKVNGHDCKILYFPPDSLETIGLMLEMGTISEKVTFSFTFSLLDKCGRPSSKACQTVSMMTFYPGNPNNCCLPSFMKQSELEAHFLRDGCFTLVCSVTILNESYKEVPKRFVNGIMPFSIDEHFAQLLDRKETSDVRFEVKGKIFTAHRLVLAARSPVFNAELFGPMAESKTKTITIKDIEPAVFKAMLHFIYTDSLPDMSHENIPLVSMTQHLLAAAVRYALDGLERLCENYLMWYISMDTAVSTLKLADELDLEDLREKCLSFVCDPINLVQLSVTDDYVQLMVRYPSLLQEISFRVRAKFVDGKPFFTDQVPN